MAVKISQTFAFPVNALRYRELGITQEEFILLLHLTLNPDRPIKQLAGIMGLSERNSRRIKASLQEKGFLIVTPTFLLDGSQSTNEYDVSPFYLALESLDD